jgi:hypothetical protein
VTIKKYIYNKIFVSAQSFKEEIGPSLI